MPSTQQIMDSTLTEAEFRARIMELAKLTGWECYYTRDSRLCTARGFPDTCFYHPRKLHLGVLIWELKVGDNTLSKEQKLWLAAFAVNNPHAREVRPEHWEYVVETLREK